MVELLVRFWVEGGEGTDRLGGQGATVHKEEDALGDPGFHEPVDLVDQGEGLARSRGHGHEHLALAGSDGLLHRLVRLSLVRAQAVMGVWGG